MLEKKEAVFRQDGKLTFPRFFPPPGVTSFGGTTKIPSVRICYVVLQRRFMFRQDLVELGTTTIDGHPFGPKLRPLTLWNIRGKLPFGDLYEVINGLLGPSFREDFLHFPHLPEVTKALLKLSQKPIVVGFKTFNNEPSIVSQIMKHPKTGFEDVKRIRNLFRVLRNSGRRAYR